MPADPPPPESATAGAAGSPGPAGRPDHPTVPGVTVDGRALSAEPGQTIAAALIAAGVRHWRSTRHAGRPRGLFCGIGICFDCLLTVNGVPNVRACLTPVLPGDRIQTQESTGDGRGDG
jgi:predicted molibdopterin-dependent oxidoreductase YjgC